MTVAKKAGEDAAERAKEKVIDAFTIGPTVEGIDKTIKDAGKDANVEKSVSQINQEKFQSVLEGTITLKFTKIMSSKKESEAYLSYIDAINLTAQVRNIFNNILNTIPPQVEAACLLSEAVLAPSTEEKMNKIKATIGVAGGAAGISLVIGGIGMALGWGASMIAGAKAFILGSSTGEPTIIVVSGLTLVILAGYFASTSNKQTDTERFLRVLKNAIEKAVEAIWPQYETELTRAVAQAEPTNADSAK